MRKAWRAVTMPGMEDERKNYDDGEGRVSMLLVLAVSALIVAALVAFTFLAAALL